jgi:hypothetical protein
MSRSTCEIFVRTLKRLENYRRMAQQVGYFQLITEFFLLAEKSIVFNHKVD